MLHSFQPFHDVESNFALSGPIFKIWVDSVKPQINLRPAIAWSRFYNTMAVSYLLGLAIEHVKSNDPFVLKAREAFLIKKFDSFRNGLNKDPGSWTSLASVGTFLIQFWFSYSSISLNNFQYCTVNMDFDSPKLISQS